LLHSFLSFDPHHLFPKLHYITFYIISPFRAFVNILWQFFCAKSDEKRAVFRGGNQKQKGPDALCIYFFNTNSSAPTDTYILSLSKNKFFFAFFAFFPSHFSKKACFGAHSRQSHQIGLFPVKCNRQVTMTQRNAPAAFSCIFIPTRTKKAGCFPLGSTPKITKKADFQSSLYNKDNFFRFTSRFSRFFARGTPYGRPFPLKSHTGHNYPMQKVFSAHGSRHFFDKINVDHP